MHHAESANVTQHPSMFDYLGWLSKELDKIQADVMQTEIRPTPTLTTMQKRVKARDNELNAILDVFDGDQIRTCVALDQLVRIWTRWRSFLN
jgi:hypothetical protein